MGKMMSGMYVTGIVQRTMPTGHKYTVRHGQKTQQEWAVCDICGKEKKLSVVGQVYDLSPERNPLNMCNACSKDSGFSNGIVGRGATGSAAQFLS